MKVLYDHQIFASQLYGGVSRYFVEIASRIGTSDGVDAAILCPMFVNRYLPGRAGLRVWGRHVPRPPRSTVAMRTINAALAPAYREARKGTDIYHETYFSRIDIAPPRAKRVITVHDMIHEKFPGDFSALDRTRTAKAAAIRRADHVICVSQNTRRDLLEIMALDPGRVSVIGHGSSLQCRTSLPPGARKPQLLYVGARDHYKNFAGLLDAFSLSRLPAEGFSVLCFGGGGFSSEERASFRARGVAHRVTHVAGDDSVLLQLLRESAALVYPSLYEGFGIPPLEAMACGCPVVSSNLGSLPEVVGQAAESFDPRELEQMVAAIEAVALSPTRSAQLIHDGYLQADKFSWDRSAQATLELYRGLA